MAFPMFATVVWLVWVLGQQSGIDGAGALLLLLVALSLLVWALTLKGRTRAGTCYRFCSGSRSTGGATGQYITQPPASGPSAAAGDGWQAWVAGPGGADRGHGPAGVCGLHRRLVRDLPVQQEDHVGQRDSAGRPGGQERRIAARADWTRRDPAITAALAQLGRNGVPVYVFYKKGSAPVVLSEILGVEEVRSVISKL
jgi:thiol:disulfide interchange protein